MSNPVPLPAPVALAQLVDHLAVPGVSDPVWEPKWDGYRALVSAGKIYSRRGTDLTQLFPDLVPILREQLASDMVLDGELVAWDPDAGRLDFDALQSRMTAGRRIGAVAARRPAQFVAFDVLSDGKADLRRRPLRQRRKVLERALSSTTSPVVLCQQTDDSSVASEWLETLSVAGIEGVVIKDAGSSYPTRDNQRVWWKVKARTTLDMIAIGFTGTAASPNSLVLAFAGDVSEEVPVTAGSTTALNRAGVAAITPLLRPTGASFERVFAWGGKAPTVVHVVEPFVVEVSADASAAAGTLRHAARLVRARPDLEINDL